MLNLGLYDSTKDNAILYVCVCVCMCITVSERFSSKQTIKTIKIYPHDLSSKPENPGIVE